MCTLPSDAIQARRADLLPGLADRASRRHATVDGYRLVFDASSETLRAITDVIDAERQCCRWMRFELVVSPGGGEMALTVRGPGEAREFFDALLM